MRTKSRSSGSEVVLLTSPYRALIQWLLEAFVVRYSGATARDSHPIPYSPKAMAQGTFRLRTNHILCLYKKNYAIYRVFCAVQSNRILQFRTKHFLTHRAWMLRLSRSDAQKSTPFSAPVWSLAIDESLNWGSIRIIRKKIAHPDWWAAPYGAF
jgi:hypothetical protein